MFTRSALQLFFNFTPIPLPILQNHAPTSLLLYHSYPVHPSRPILLHLPSLPPGPSPKSLSYLPSLPPFYPLSFVFPPSSSITFLLSPIPLPSSSLNLLPLPFLPLPHPSFLPPPCFFPLDPWGSGCWCECSLYCCYRQSSQSKNSEVRRTEER